MPQGLLRRHPCVRLQPQRKLFLSSLFLRSFLPPLSCQQLSFSLTHSPNLLLSYGQTGSGKTHSLMNGGERGAQKPHPRTHPHPLTSKHRNTHPLNTSSPATHTLPGDLSEAGLFPRLAVDLFTAISADYRNVYNVEVSFAQARRDGPSLSFGRAPPRRETTSPCALPRTL